MIDGVAHRIAGTEPMRTCIGVVEARAHHPTPLGDTAECGPIERRCEDVKRRHPRQDRVDFGSAHHHVVGEKRRRQVTHHDRFVVTKVHHTDDAVVDDGSS